jgi:hypothetical protein
MLIYSVVDICKSPSQLSYLLIRSEIYVCNNWDYAVSLAATEKSQESFMIRARKLDRDVGVAIWNPLTSSSLSDVKVPVEPVSAPLTLT